MQLTRSVEWERIGELAEETMIDTANLLAEFAARDLSDQLLLTQDYQVPLSIDQKKYY